ncbi:hypothetical protein MWU59_06495 [Flavobacteriaceae bacterium F08102]|nr:hypothetical protein [Flavobacteriaceae bacterium F08102]
MMNNTFAGLGLLGLGARSTLFYIHELNAMYNQQKGGYSTCPFVMVNTDFNEINPYLPNQFDQLEASLSNILTRFEELGVEQLLIPNITLHETIDRLAPRINIIHPIHLAIEHFRESEQDQAVCFGSSYTMTAPYVQGYFSGAGITVLAPEECDKTTIDNFRKKVYFGQESMRDIEEFQHLVAQYASQTNVLIACTELSLFVPKGIQQVCDMAELQIEKAVKCLTD